VLEDRDRDELERFFLPMTSACRKSLISTGFMDPAL